MTSAEPEIIAPAAARQAIMHSIVANLGTEWEREWLVIHNSDYLIRLNKGDINRDFACDLLGVVGVSDHPIHPLQASGRFLAAMILGSSLFVALFIALVTGVLR